MFARHTDIRFAFGRDAVAFLLILPALVAFGVWGCGNDDTTKPGDENHPPTINTFTADLPIVAPGDTASVTCLGLDADGDDLGYAWSAPSGLLIGSGATVEWQAPTGDGPHEIYVAVTDGHGGTVRDTLSVDVMGGTILVASRLGLHAVDAYGGKFLLSNSGSNVEVLGTRIFRGPGGTVQEMGLDGEYVSSISIPGVSGYDFTMLPDGGLALMDNVDDEVHFISAAGTLIETVAMPEASEDLQDVDGVVDGNRLLVTENGNHGVLAFDLTTREASIFRTMSSGNLAAIDYYDGTCYVGGGSTVRAFTETGAVIDICTLPAWNITGLVVVGSYAYAVVNFGNSMYRIDVRTGVYEQVLSDLDYPRDIEYYPVRLEP